jgi:acyl dehydratase
VARRQSTVHSDARYFEDLEVGTVSEAGRYEVTEEEIVEFGEQYDPQPFHVDPEAAEASIYGGLIASGWQTAAITMRMLVEHVVDHETSMGSPGVDELRWSAPVRPGDVLRVRHELLEKRELESRPDRGLVRYRSTTLNQDDEEVMTMVGLGLVAKRETGEDASSPS